MSQFKTRTVRGALAAIGLITPIALLFQNCAGGMQTRASSQQDNGDSQIVHAFAQASTTQSCNMIENQILSDGAAFLGFTHVSTVAECNSYCLSVAGANACLASMAVGDCYAAKVADASSATTSGDVGDGSFAGACN